MKKLNWKAGLAALIILTVCVFGTNVIINQSKNFDVHHHAAVVSEVGPDGRAPVGSPAEVEVSISSELAWEMTNDIFRKGVWVAIILAAGYLLFYASGKILWNGTAFFAMLVLAFSLYLGRFVSTRWNNSVRITPEKFEQIKNDREALAGLFTGKTLIR
jgi:hypothetical protein